MKNFLLCVLLALGLMPPLAVAQEPADDQNRLLPFSRSFSIAASAWPFYKERLRLGYQWELTPSRQLSHEIAYIYAGKGRLKPRDWNSDWTMPLEGFQLRNELRFFQKSQGPGFWYSGISLAYMYSKHTFSKSINCKNGTCDYYQGFENAKAHTTTLAGTFGIVLCSGKRLNFNFFTALGLRGSYFPEQSGSGYFGRKMVLLRRDDFALDPYLNAGTNLMFTLRNR